MLENEVTREALRKSGRRTGSTRGSALDEAARIVGKIVGMSASSLRYGAPAASRARKRIPISERQPLERPSSANAVWSMDFVFDRVAGGRTIQNLAVAHPEAWIRPLSAKAARKPLSESCALELFDDVVDEGARLCGHIVLRLAIVSEIAPASAYHRGSSRTSSPLSSSRRTSGIAIV